MRSRYWSCTEFARKIQKLGGLTPKPYHGTSEEWIAWEAANESKFVYWLTEEFFDEVQNFIYWPKDKLNELTRWYENRFVNTSHAVVTTLKRGSWHECDELMLYANFQILVDFICEQKAWMNYEERKSRPWYERIWPFYRFVKLNDEKSGLDYLDWEMKLIKDDAWLPKDSPDYGKPTPQAESAKEQCELYHWWVYQRPNRIDPYDTKEFERIKNEFGEEEYFNEIDRIETAYYEEDTEMLIRLIKIRSHLWT